MPEDIRIILAEDSPTIRRYLANLIEEAPGMRVVGEARNGEEIVKLVAERRPDVVSMDIRMPLMDGLEATRRIMAQSPTPVVVVSGLLESDVELSLQALEAGALAVVGKPPDRSHPDFEERRRQLLTTLRAMSGVKVISRRRYPRPAVEVPVLETAPLRSRPEVVVIGASTGGPSALHRLLKGFPADFPLPILIVQHMPGEFIGGLVNWLNSATSLQVMIARDGVPLQSGQVLVSPGNMHLTLERQRGRLFTRLIPEAGQHRHQPSVDALFLSAARVCGSAAAGVILTGMGSDGAVGLLALRQAGGITFAQDEMSCTVYGMPGAAVAIGAVQQIEPLINLPLKITELV